MNGLDKMIVELKAMNAELEQSNDNAERREFFRKYPWLSERDFQTQKALDAKIGAYYAQPVEIINRDLVAAHDETASRGWSTE